VRNALCNWVEQEEHPGLWAKKMFQGEEIGTYCLRGVLKARRRKRRGSERSRLKREEVRASPLDGTEEKGVT